MRINRFRYIILAFVCILILTLASACSCGDAAEHFLENVSVSDVLPSDETDPIRFSDSDISPESTISTSASDSLKTTETSKNTSTTTTVMTTTATKSTTTAKTTTTKAPSGNNAPGVNKPNYETKYYIVVHTGSQSVAVYGKDGNGYYNKLVKCFTCSTGSKGHETRTGQYKIWRKFHWRALVGGVYGQYNSSISTDYLFHSVPYLKDRYDTLDNKEYDKLGSPASHGCIRLCARDAKWIYDNCAIGTQVYITNTSGPSGAGVPRRNTDPVYNGWDPSDKWAKGNPYFTTPTTTATTATTTTASTTITSETTTTTTTTTTTATTEAETTTTTTTTAATTTTTVPAETT